MPKLLYLFKVGNIKQKLITKPTLSPHQQITINLSQSLSLLQKWLPFRKHPDFETHVKHYLLSPKMETGEMIEWHQLDKRKYFILAPSFFMVVRGLVYPFNLIKTRLYMQEKKSIYTGTTNAFIKIAQYEGISGLYRGFLFNSFGLVAGQVYIITYELVRSRLHGYRTELKGLLAGGCATVMGQTVTVPVDIITQHRMMAGQFKYYTKGMAQSTQNLPTAVDIVKDIMRREGFRGFFKGYHVSLMTYAPNSALWWSFYSGAYEKAVQFGLLDYFPLPVVQSATGVVAAVLAASITNPMDVLRTRYQLEQDNTFRETCRQFWQNEGIRGFTKGLSARLAATIPTAAIMVTSYELVKRLSLKVS